MDTSAALLAPSLQWGTRNRRRDGQHFLSRIIAHCAPWQVVTSAMEKQSRESKGVAEFK